jgi:hypothetical protein
MHDIQHLYDRSAIIGNSSFVALMDELVHTPWSESGLDALRDSETGCDVGEDLSLPLGVVSAFAKE